MQATERLDENPCRPRHFKPPPCAPVATDERAAALLETCRSRLVMTAALFALVFVVVALRLTEIVAFAGTGVEPHTARSRPVATPAPVRADILDRNGALLATTLDSPSLYADPRQILDPAEAARALSTVLPQLNTAEVQAKLSSGKSFVWLKRHLTPKQVYDVNKLGIPGLQFEHEERRVYPFSDLAAHVVGYCGIDNNGLAGIERALDGTTKSSRQPIELSLDARVQFILHEELAKVVTDFSAKGAAGIIMDVRNGEIVAMVSLPDFDPNHPAAMTPADAKERIFNKITLGDYEMGSAFKIFNTAMALDAGTATMTKSYDAIHDLHIGRFTISDYHGKHRMLSVPEVFMYSSNLGSARIAMEAGATRQRAFLERLGLTEPMRTEAGAVAPPMLPKHWGRIETITVGYGHGLAVAPLQFAAAAAALVNGGAKVAPTLLARSDGGGERPRVVSAATSAKLGEIMRLNVTNPGGTGRHAEAEGYRVGGKTGTAEMPGRGGYQEKSVISSFLGAFPMDAPKYVILVSLFEPQSGDSGAGRITAGLNAAPATARIVERIAPLLGLLPRRLEARTPETAPFDAPPEAQ